MRVSQTISNGNQTVALIPVSPLAATTQYTVNVANVQDFSGNVLPARITSTFTTANSADLTTPRLSTTNPVANTTGVSTSTTIQVQFSKPINPLTVPSSTFYAYLYVTSIPAAGTISVSADGQAATLTPSEPLASSTLYYVQLTSGITDLEGHSLGTSNYFSFTTGQGGTEPPPVIAALSPARAAVGATVDINGSYFGTSQGSSTVTFNGVEATVTSWGDAQIVVTVPSGATTGNIVVTVNGVASNAMLFTVQVTPSTTSISPTSATVGTGSDFGSTQSNSTVNFYGSSTQPTIQSWSDTAITLSVPADATTGPVYVQVGSLNALSPTDFSVNQITKLTDSLGNHSQYTFSVQGGEWFTQNSSGSGCSTCSVRGNITNVPDVYGNIQTSTDDIGSTSTYTHDGNSNVTSASQPLNSSTTATTSYTYNSFSEVLTMTDPLGNLTTNTYDPHGNLLTVTTPKPNANTSASVTQFAYDNKGELTQITDPLNHVTTLTYNSVGLIASITDAQNNTTSYQYDAFGNLSAITGSITNPVRYTGREPAHPAQGEKCS